MTGPYDQNALVAHHAEGEAQRVLSVKSRFGHGYLGGAPLFIRVVILEVISDPSVIDTPKLTHWEHDLGVANIKYAGVAPRNSIIAKRVLGNGATASEKTMVLYPFFPPHVAFPAKPGEHVWAIFENPDAKVNELGYWMCRIVGPHFVEDVNYSHSDRQFDPSFVPGIADTFEGTDDPKYEFPNGVVDDKDGQRFIVGNTATIAGGDEKAYETLLKETEASKMMKYEPVPRYRKRPGDTAFEGTNNSLIVLGTDRTGPVADYDDDPDKGKIPKAHDGDNPSDSGAGMIDLVAGRGQTDDTAGKSVDNSLSRKELGKSKKDLVDKEGDPDLKADRSRIYVTAGSHIDKNFGLDAYNKANYPDGTGAPGSAVTDGDGFRGAVVIKSDKVRLIARADVEILVTGYTNDPKGNWVQIDDNSKWAAIVIRSNGDIIFKPSATGLIKLGGDDADKAVLCTTVNNKGAGGTVTATPIVDTMAGVQGAADGNNGTFAKKVLLK